MASRIDIKFRRSGPISNRILRNELVELLARRVRGWSSNLLVLSAVLFGFGYTSLHAGISVLLLDLDIAVNEQLIVALGDGLYPGLAMLVASMVSAGVSGLLAIRVWEFGIVKFPWILLTGAVLLIVVNGCILAPFVLTFITSATI